MGGGQYKRHFEGGWECRTSEMSLPARARNISSLAHGIDVRYKEMAFNGLKATPRQV